MEDLVKLRLFDNIYKDRKVLITGHTGFKGSWLAAWLTRLGAHVTGYSLLPESNPNHYSLLDLNMKSVVADIRDMDQLKNVIQSTQPEIVFHLAAQSLVRRSYRQPIATYQTNVIGTLNLYEACLFVGSVKAVVCITSDKVYENKESQRPYKETDPLGGYDMYSSSKACVELMTNSFRSSFLINDDGSYKLGLITARAGNVIGGGDWAEDRLIPDVIRAIGNGDKVTVRNPSAVRPWQHVLEPLSGYLLLGQLLLQKISMKQHSWNFGPAENELITVKEVLDYIKKILPEAEYVLEKRDALHEAGMLAVDSSHAMDQLKWMPVWTTNTAIEKTALWYKYFLTEGISSTFENMDEYVEAARQKNLIWAKS